MPIEIDMRGRRYGRLVVQRRGVSPSVKYGVSWWCRCDCGSRVNVNGRSLRSGSTRSCGCLNREMSRARATRHGQRRSAEYRAWRAMLTRCTNPNAEKYDYYGGRGVMVCDAWRDFATFLRDVGVKPSPRLTLDRIDPNGNYEPGNVRWATWPVQRANRRLRGDQPCQ